MIKRGDTVRWVQKGEFQGFRAAPVVSVDEQTVVVLTHEGDYITLDKSTVQVPQDGRMLRLQVIEHESPQEADQLREEYIQAWVKKIEDQAERERESQPQTEDEKPKRQRRSKVASSSDADLIVSTLDRAEYRLAKSDILEATGLTEGRYNAALKKLKDSGTVSQHGTRRGATYSLRSRDLPAKPQDIQPREKKVSKAAERDAVVLDQHLESVVEYIVEAAEKVSRADVIRDLGVTSQEWAVIARELPKHPRIEVTGKKRGTRYEAV